MTDGQKGAAWAAMLYTCSPYYVRFHIFTFTLQRHKNLNYNRNKTLLYIVLHSPRSKHFLSTDGKYKNRVVLTGMSACLDDNRKNSLATHRKLLADGQRPGGSKIYLVLFFITVVFFGYLLAFTFSYLLDNIKNKSIKIKHICVTLTSGGH